MGNVRGGCPECMSGSPCRIASLYLLRFGSPWLTHRQTDRSRWILADRTGYFRMDANTSTGIYCTKRSSSLAKNKGTSSPYQCPKLRTGGYFWLFVVRQWFNSKTVETVDDKYTVRIRLHHLTVVSKGEAPPLGGVHAHLLNIFGVLSSLTLNVVAKPGSRPV